MHYGHALASLRYGLQQTIPITTGSVANPVQYGDHLAIYNAGVPATKNLPAEAMSISTSLAV